MTGNVAAILVVDDDVDACQNLADILGDLGYSVDVAHDGPSALEKVRRRAYDVALLDLKMPGMDGLTLYREIRKLQSSAVAIIVTAFAGGALAEQALAAGAAHVVAKPVDFPRLRRLVDEAVGQPLVMVIDDDADLCASLWDLLRERGFRVGIAHNEREASERLADQAFKVVLIDMKLPNGSGASVYRLVRGHRPEARTVLITGYRAEMDAVVRQVVAEGADAVCYKPFDVAALLQTVAKLAGGSPDEAGAPPTQK
jgi:two-component system, NtrC family, response regulator HydG